MKFEFFTISLLRYLILFLLRPVLCNIPHQPPCAVNQKKYGENNTYLSGKISKPGRVCEKPDPEQDKKGGNRDT
jgi:hypothetical protein